MVRLNVSKMVCGGCARSITSAIRELDPNAQIEVDVASRDVTVITVASQSALIEAIGKAGYEATASEQPSSPG